jgi:hypothetical protein
MMAVRSSKMRPVMMASSLFRIERTIDKLKDAIQRGIDDGDISVADIHFMFKIAEQKGRVVILWEDDAKNSKKESY